MNRHHFVYVEGVGPPPKKKPTKGRNFLPAPWIYVGRKVVGVPGESPLANPYRPDRTLSHDEALRLYRRRLWNLIRNNDWRIMLAMRSITDETALVCSCAPRPCHADVVQRAWIWMRDNHML